MTLTLDFADPRCAQAPLTGGKAVGLAEMAAAGVPVAPGFVVTADAYDRFLGSDGTREWLERELDGLDAGDLSDLEARGHRIVEGLEARGLPADVERAVRDGYEALARRCGVPDLAVAVRSSATAEDGAGTSFAGEFETWLDVRGADDVVAHVRRCFASVYGGRGLGYMAVNAIDPATVRMAVVVQKVVRARAAGVMLTIDPTTGDRSRIVIECSWGLGLAVVGGEVTPDRLTVDKVALAVTDRVLGDKRIEYRTGDRTTPVPPERQGVLSLSDAQAISVARLGKQLERRGGRAQDVEFAIDEELPDGENLVLLQCRPETVWSATARRPAFDAGQDVMSWITRSVSGPPATATPDGTAGDV